MPSFPASPRQVIFALFPGVMLLDLAGPAQVFDAAAGLASQRTGTRAYDINVVSMDGGLVQTDLGFGLHTIRQRAWADAAVDRLIVPGGAGALLAAKDAPTVAWIAEGAGFARRTASVCLGAFILAAAGLLDGRRVTTHWAYCDALRSARAAAHVQSDPIYLRDGAVWTSAGVTAGIDLALALVEEDCGRAMASEVARRLVVFLRRPGGQAQFSAALSAQVADRDGAFSDLLAWIATHPDADLCVEALADRMAMSPRSFARTFTARVGLTPAKAVEAMRTERARALMEQQPGLAIEAVARNAGFGDPERMRRAFTRSLGISPAAYRSRFG